MTSAWRCAGGALVLGGILALDPGAASAAELSLSWTPVPGAAGYRVYVGRAAGIYGRVIDVGPAPRTTVAGLEDERLYHIAVKAHDRSGHESRAFSTDLACLPRPRVMSVDPVSIAPGKTAFVTLVGANFERALRVRSLDDRVAVRSIVAAGRGRVIVLLEAPAGPVGEASAPVRLEPGMFGLISGCRKSEEFFRAHPEAADIDGNGCVDERDLESVRSTLGTQRGEAGYSEWADLDGDGWVDGGDMSRVTARLAPPGACIALHAADEVGPAPRTADE